MARDYAAIQVRRNEIAREHGFSGYGQARRWRRAARSLIEEDIGELPPTDPDWTKRIDRLGLAQRNVATTGQSGFTQDELYETVAEIYEEFLGEDEGAIWAIIRDFYPTPGAHHAAA